MKKIAVVLSGCGVFDGSEIYEATLLLLALDKAGAQIQCVAPDINQHHVINFITKKDSPTEARNVLTESARLARGNILKLSEININDFDGFAFPGGLGAAKNLSDFAFKGENYEVHPEIAHLIKEAYSQKKALGFICIAPMLAAKTLGKHSIQLTIGNDPETAKIIEAQGAKHIQCLPNEAVVDKEHKIVSTPAFMLAKSIKEIEPGITQLVKELLKLS